MFGLRGQELLIILLVVLLLFGARKLPELARSLGASAKEFRKGIQEGSGETVTDDEAAGEEDGGATDDTATRPEDGSRGP